MDAFTQEMQELLLKEREKYEFSAADMGRLFDKNKSVRKKSVVMMTYLTEDDYMRTGISWKTKLKLKYLR